MKTRPLLHGLAALLIAGALPAAAVAQSLPGVVMAAFGGGNGETWREMMGKPFNKETSIPVRIVDLPTTEAAIRASAGNPQYNVAWVGFYAATTLYKDGMIEGLNLADFPELKNVPEQFILKAADGKLLGIPVQFQYYGIAYNTQQAKASDFQSWTSLGEPKWKGKIAAAQAFIGASYDLPMYAHIAGGNVRNLEPGLPEFRKFTKNALTVLTSFAQGNTLLSRGEVAALPFYSARVRSLKKEGAPVDIVIPKEGGLMLPYMLVVPAGAKNRDDLMKFLRYASEPAGQVRMFEFSGYVPMNLRAELTGAHITDLGMPLKELVGRLYQPDYWVQSETIRDVTKRVEEIQAER